MPADPTIIPIANEPPEQAAGSVEAGLDGRSSGYGPAHPVAARTLRHLIARPGHAR